MAVEAPPAQRMGPAVQRLRVGLVAGRAGTSARPPLTAPVPVPADPSPGLSWRPAVLVRPQGQAREAWHLLLSSEARGEIDAAAATAKRLSRPARPLQPGHCRPRRLRPSSTVLACPLAL